MVLGKIGDTYQAYCNISKTHAMANHNGGSGHSLNRVIEVNRETQETADTTIEDMHGFNTPATLTEPAETDHFDDFKHTKPQN